MLTVFLVICFFLALFLFMFHFLFTYFRWHLFLQNISSVFLINLSSWSGVGVFALVIILFFAVNWLWAIFFHNSINLCTLWAEFIQSINLLFVFLQDEFLYWALVLLWVFKIRSVCRLLRLLPTRCQAFRVARWVRRRSRASWLVKVFFAFVLHKVLQSRLPLLLFLLILLVLSF